MRLFCIIGSLIIIFSFAHGQTNLGQGLVACFSFTGNANDQSGNSHHGNVIGPVLTADRFGDAGKAYQFNGVSDFIRLPHLASITMSDEFSISVWIQPDQVKLQTLLFIMPDNFVDRLNAVAYYSHNGVSSTIWDFGNCNQGGRLIQVGTTFDNSWQHWVYTIHPVNGMRIYKNGILTNSSPSSSFLTNRNRELWIGGGIDSNGAQFYFDGKIDELRLYDRALLPSEAVQLYQMEVSCSPATVLVEIKSNPPVQIRNTGGSLQVRLGELSEKGDFKFLNLSGQAFFEKSNLKSGDVFEVPSSKLISGMLLYVLQTGREAYYGKFIFFER